MVASEYESSGAHTTERTFQRTILVGDVHGCIDELTSLLDRLAYSRTDDRLVLLGDLLDRGPDPIGCIRLARELGAQCVLGNHEEKHLRYRRHETKRKQNPTYVNPMRAFGGERLAQHEGLGEVEWEWIERLPKMLDVGHGFLAVHAGLLPSRPIAAQPDRALLRLRYLDANGKQASQDDTDTGELEGMQFWTEAYDGPVSVAHGHAVRSLSEPTRTARPDGVEVFSLDTGCVFGGHLTALVLDAARPASREIVQVDARRQYVPMR